MIDWERFKEGEIVVHCNTREKALAFLNECHERGILWSSGNDANERNYWDVNAENTFYCYDGIGLWYGNIAEDYGIDKDAEVLHFANSKPSYWENVCEINRRQEEKGLSKYGQTLEDNSTLMTNQRIEHLEEELIDALKYAEHLKVILADELTANDYQRAAMRTASGMQYTMFDDPNKGLLLNGVMGLNGEAGECIDIVKKALFQGHEVDREHLIEELGDCAWYLAVSCQALGVTLEECLNRNIEKLKKRYPDGFDKARSVNREGEN